MGFLFCLEMLESGCCSDTRNNSGIQQLCALMLWQPIRARCRMLGEPQSGEGGGKPAPGSRPRGNAHPPLGWELLGSEGHCCHLVSLSPA